MKFNDLDKKMRVYEQSLDQKILPDMYMVARLDGRNFTKLTHEICKFEAPFDQKFRDVMVKTTKALMNCGFRVIYAFTESDEISLLFHPAEISFARKTRKYNSTLAGVASATISMELNLLATMDCRIIPLPNIARVQEYFLWRQEDANRNALNSYCYWTLRKEGKSVREATKMLEGKGVAFKNELLFQKGINYNNVPNWQKRGVGLWNVLYQKEGLNPITGEKTVATRSKIHEEYNLPLNMEYSRLVESLISPS